MSNVQISLASLSGIFLHTKAVSSALPPWKDIWETGYSYGEELAIELFLKSCKWHLVLALTQAYISSDTHGTLDSDRWS